MMWAVTGWALATWLKITAALALLVAGCWAWLGTSSGWFWVAAVAAAWIDLWAARALATEWESEARASWWWTR
ncbi:hypothetical protein [Pseudonocardia acidicola]|uniref:Uncharacterized protein n=1 Tax=Pseudonocardia acidicola TaxID=2724939 RepID=A0ABX1SH07_9PSEU|nr:hypothetical protein [Pseudonocardia acidicola]NMI00855.1 hypothetical protein [Pseudonocardia acidicola]